MMFSSRSSLHLHKCLFMSAVECREWPGGHGAIIKLNWCIWPYVYSTCVRNSNYKCSYLSYVHFIRAA